MLSLQNSKKGRNLLSKSSKRFWEIVETFLGKGNSLLIEVFFSGNNTALQGKPKKLVLMKYSRISEYQFGNEVMGVQLGLDTFTEKKKRKYLSSMRNGKIKNE